MNFRMLAFATLLSPIVLPYAASQTAAQTAAASALTAVPPLVPYSGQVEGPAGERLVTFLIYKEQQGGEPLFTESQMISFDQAGRYKVQLGAANPSGLPADLFSSGEARWLEVQIAGRQAEPRVLLASVPYALKAADAATLGGLPPSAFALAGSSNGGVLNAAAPGGISPDAGMAVTTTGGTANKLAKFSGSNTIVNSIVYDNGTEVGVGTTAPTATLTVAGTETVNGNTTLNGQVILPATGTATAAKGYNSQFIKFNTSAYSSLSESVVPPRFQLQAEATGNDTGSPNATLNLLASATSSAPTETGLYFNRDGTIHFATGQSFPGTGKITSVGLSAPTSDFSVSGSPVTSAGTLGLNWKVMPTNANNANSIVKRDATGSFVAGAITANLGMEGLTSISSASGVTGINNGGGIAVLGQSTQAGGIGLQGNGDIIGVHGVTTGGIGAKGEGFIGVWGESTYPSGGSDGVHGVTNSLGPAGVAGQNLAGGNGVYGAGGTGVFGTGSNYGMVTDSNVQQARTAGGWIKAMVEVGNPNAIQIKSQAIASKIRSRAAGSKIRPQANSSSPSITRCFNSTLAGAAATIPPCGITLENDETGVYILTFNFEVDDRFFSAQLVDGFSGVVAMSTDGTNAVVAGTVDLDQSLYAGNFQLIVY